MGGAVLLVPILVAAGMDPFDAAPLGLFTVAAGSLAASAPQLLERTVHHRLGVTTELAATTGAIAGALASDAAGETFLRWLLALTALAGAAAGGLRSGMRNPMRAEYGEELVGEWPGTLSGAYRVGAGVAPYRARRVPAGLVGMTFAGLVGGLAGTGGGFIKTPTMNEVMHVPVKVAAATSTFTVGITAGAALVVLAVLGRVDTHEAAAVVIGALAGGWLGARLQGRLAPLLVRRTLAVLLLIVAIVLAATA
jgi:uncharacterized membrane protein YfcA